MSIDERVVQDTTGASGFVTFSNTSTVSIQHVNGAFSSSYSITGEDSLISVTPIDDPVIIVPYFVPMTTVSKSATAVASNSTVYVENSQGTLSIQTMSDIVEDYFSPVTAYDYEMELNEQKKNINILDSRYASSMEASFVEAINQ